VLWTSAKSGAGVDAWVDYLALAHEAFVSGAEGAGVTGAGAGGARAMPATPAS
jgi:hypothetical protein